jgi:hypothetical protein
MQQLVACRYCEEEGRWRSGICPKHRQYIKRAGGRKLGWRIARRNQVSTWITILDESIPADEKPKTKTARKPVQVVQTNVVPMRRRA